MDDKKFLISVKEYIEKAEFEYDNEWGEGRKLEKIIADGDMPEIYQEVIARLKNVD